MSDQEQSDFHYLLSLMPPLHDIPEFAILPELFSIVGHSKLISMCRYMGGETVRIPTLEELTTSVEALQWYYDIYIQKKKTVDSLPTEYKPLVDKICEVYSSARYN